MLKYILYLTFFNYSLNVENIDFTVLPIHPQSEEIVSKKLKIPADYCMKAYRKIQDSQINNYVILKPECIPEGLNVSLNDIQNVTYNMDNKDSEPEVSMTLSEDGKKRIASIVEFTKLRYPQYPRLAVILADRVVSAPGLSQADSSGIGGFFLILSVNNVKMMKQMLSERADDGHERTSRYKDTKIILSAISSDIEHCVDARYAVNPSRGDYSIYLYNEIKESALEHNISSQYGDAENFINYHQLNMELLEKSAHTILLSSEESKPNFEEFVEQIESIKRNNPIEYQALGCYLETAFQLWETRVKSQPEKAGSTRELGLKKSQSVSDGFDQINFNGLPISVQLFLISYTKKFLILEMELDENEKIDKKFIKESIQILSTTDTKLLPLSYKEFIQLYMKGYNDILVQEEKGTLNSADSRLLLLRKRYPTEFDLIADRGRTLNTVLKGLDLYDYYKFLVYSSAEKINRFEYINEKLVEAIEKAAGA